MSSVKHDVVVIGGGNAGISVAARMLRKGKLDVAIVEPRDQHFFQPLFSHIAAGAAKMNEAVRPQHSVMPKQARWIQNRVTHVQPEENTVLLADGTQVEYKQLIVCPGLQLDFNAIPGLPQAMDGVTGSSDYDPALVTRTWSMIEGLAKGTAVFVQPPGPAKCAGAAQKVAYMACDYWRSAGRLADIEVHLVVPSPTVFGMPDVDAELNRKIREYGIELHTSSTLESVNAETRSVNLDAGAEKVTLSYDLLHVVPPQSAPDWLKATDLPRPETYGGFVDVDDQHLRHRRYRNVWSLGDAAGSSNSKSGGALRKQTKVVALNVLDVLAGKEPRHSYNGYSVCPFTLSRGTAFFAEFDQQYRPMKSYPVLKMAKERRWQWVMDRWIFPQIYWHMILKGRA